MGIMDIMDMARHVSEYANDEEFFLFFVCFDKMLRTGLIDPPLSDDDIKDFNIDAFTDSLNRLLSEIGDDEECGVEKFVELRRGH